MFFYNHYYVLLDTAKGYLKPQVRNEAAEYFLSLLKEWKKLCVAVGLLKCIDEKQSYADPFMGADGGGNVDNEFKVEKVLDICYEGDSKGVKGRGLCLKVIHVIYCLPLVELQAMLFLGHCYV